MSYIDSFDHEYIGQLGYLPIYRPLEVIHGEGWGGYDFSATPDNLVLGGGSGEHPALVLHRLEALAVRFLYDQITEDEAQTLEQADKAYLDDLYFSDRTLEFCQWNIRHYADLQKMAESSSFLNPLSQDQSVEQWIAQSMGELIHYALPDLNPDHQKQASILERFDIRPTMRNVAIVPPGYPSCGGRTVENGRMKWGRHRW